MENIENKKYWIWMSLIKGIGAKRKNKLLEIYKTPERIYNATKIELKGIKWLNEKAIQEILNIELKEKVKYHIKYMEEKNIDIIEKESEKYPKLLKDIYDPPICLYIKGNKEILNNNNIAIVGARKCSEYGEKTAKYFAYNLAKENYTIVSGLAKGIDSYSHIGTLQIRGKTIAVIGNGLNTIYPRENQELANKIIERNGAIITEYPLGTQPLKMNFPARNRIISGISKGIIIVEAKEKSGTMITADFALEQGKEVYAVPGNINLENSLGTNELIRQGATLITNWKQIIDI